MKKLFLSFVILFLSSSLSYSASLPAEEIVFRSGQFFIVGDLRLSEGNGPHPVVIFVHGDGPNNRTSGVTYPPIMERMLRAGYATFAWDKPGTGESKGKLSGDHVVKQRAQIVLDAIDILKKHNSIDPGRIGLWGISQAGYVMPRVLEKSEDIAFMIAVSCPGEAGVDQGSYLVTAQALCEGLSREDAKQVENLLSAIERATNYQEYLEYKKRLDAYPIQKIVEKIGFLMRTRTEEEWHVPNLDGDYFWDPMTIIKKVKIPVLAFFGEKDTQIDPIQGAQAYREALERAGNKNFRIELIPGVDHNLIISETGSIKERSQRSARGWKNYATEYLDILEQWLRELKF